jgi:hypothetical protein
VFKDMEWGIGHQGSNCTLLREKIPRIVVLYRHVIWPDVKKP